MVWLAGQIFVLCLVSFLAGAAITAVALRLRAKSEQPPAGEPPAEEMTAEETTAEKPAEEPEAALPTAGETTDVMPVFTEDPQIVAATEPVIIKASKKSMRYHTPDSPYYNRVKGELTFPSIEEAELAGYTAWNKTVPLEKAPLEKAAVKS